MLYKAVKIAVIESECGLSVKPTDYMICLNMDQANEWETEYNSQNATKNASGCICQSNGKHEKIELNENQYNELKRTGGYKWFSSLKNL